jgi:dienelactone hydrolase
VNAAECLKERGENIEPLIDAIERTLQSRILVWHRTGQFFGGLGSWEEAAGLIRDTSTWYELYKRPEDRDRARDYREGSVAVGGAPPEGVVYFQRVLSFYLRHRPVERLFHPNEILNQVLGRVRKQPNPYFTRIGAAASAPASTDYLPFGVEAFLPTFRDSLIERLTFPQRYDAQKWPSFALWRHDARATLLRTLLKPPPRADFGPVVIAREDRGSYEAQKLVFSVSADSRIPAYLLVPRGKGPFPAVVALHDHGAFFAIGKEKVVRPFDESPDRIKTAQAWVEKNYGNRFIGDELAGRGYVVLAIDALFWGDRGRREGIDYTAQQALASNLFQLGMTWLGVITWDDMRSAEFLASLPQVDPQRIAAVGLSMGAHRTWMLAAATDRIAAGMAICWMGTTPALIAPGNNQVKGHSAYSMIAPDLPNHLDRPDVASIACPTPMLFYNGEQDGLFPLMGVEDAYALMRRVWDSQGASDKLVTRIWPRPHVFDLEMQEAAFAWLDTHLKR